MGSVTYPVAFRTNAHARSGSPFLRLDGTDASDGPGTGVGGLWDPASLYVSTGNTHFVLSNGNRTANRVLTAGVGNAYSKSSRAVTGKYYWEVVLDTIDASSYQPIVGVCDLLTWGKQAAYSNGTGFWGIQAGTNAYDYGNDQYQASGRALVQGDVVLFAVDLSTRKIWFGYNGIWLHSGNPATGAGAAWATLPVSNAINIAVYTNGKAVQVTLRTRASEWGYSPPSGFGAW